MRPEDDLKEQRIQAVAAATETVRNEDKIQLVLAYLGILAIIPLLTVKDSPFVQWHAKQGLVLGVGGAIGIIVLSTILGFIPFIGWIASCFAWLGWLAVDIVAMVKALNGERYRIPVVTDLAEKL